MTTGRLGAQRSMPKSAMKSPPEYLAICSATVEILGAHWPQKSTIWSGLRLHEATVLESGPTAGDHHLAVRWCHISNASDGTGDAIYRLRAKDDRYRFYRAANGAWVLRLAPVG